MEAHARVTVAVFPALVSEAKVGDVTLARGFVAMSIDSTIGAPARVIAADSRIEYLIALFVKIGCWKGSY